MFPFNGSSISLNIFFSINTACFFTWSSGELIKMKPSAESVLKYGDLKCHLNLSEGSYEIIQLSIYFHADSS